MLRKKYCELRYLYLFLLSTAESAEMMLFGLGNLFYGNSSCLPSLDY
jgi:hypothetical protein